MCVCIVHDSMCLYIKKSIKFCKIEKKKFGKIENVLLRTSSLVQNLLKKKYRTEAQKKEKKNSKTCFNDNEQKGERELLVLLIFLFFWVFLLNDSPFNASIFHFSIAFLYDRIFLPEIKIKTS